MSYFQFLYKNNLRHRLNYTDNLSTLIESVGSTNYNIFLQQTPIEVYKTNGIFGDLSESTISDVCSALHRRG